MRIRVRVRPTGLLSSDTDSGAASRNTRGGPRNPPRGGHHATTNTLHRSGLMPLILMTVGGIAAPSASADCTNAGYATVCAQGEVRGGGPTPRRQSSTPLLLRRPVVLR